MNLNLLVSAEMNGLKMQLPPEDWRRLRFILRESLTRVALVAAAKPERTT